MEATLEIDEDLLTTAEQAASEQGQTLSAFVEKALRVACAFSPKGLTARELEILALVYQGFGQQEIAVRLSLSRSVVRYRLSKIRAALQVGTRGEAASLPQSRQDSRNGERVELPTFRGKGLRPGVNLNDSAGLLELMESPHAPD
jgi:DNA-binding CsgD family transcriptional regulator